jgi:hypothetical protein
MVYRLQCFELNLYTSPGNICALSDIRACVQSSERKSVAK